MKKFLTRVIALALVSLMFAMPCMAATYSSVTYEGDTITVSLDGYNQGDESTVIIVKSGVDLATVYDFEIVNIDQKPVVSADGKVSFDLPVDERAQEIGVKAVDIYIGGSSMDDAVKYAETITLNEQAVITYVYTASFKSGKTTFTTDAEAKDDVIVKKIKYENGVATGEEQDVTTMATIVVNNGVISVSMLEADFEATLNYSLATLGISGIVEWGEGEMPLENALVYLYDGETLKGVTLTAADGSYSFRVGAGTYKVVVSASYVDTYDYAVYQMTPVSADVTVVDSVAAKSFTVDLPLYGDVTGDGKVNREDTSAVMASYTE